MKFLCVKCDEPMSLKNVGSGGGPMDLTFACAKCGNEVAMLTNQQETRMMESLGLNPGAMQSPSSPAKSPQGGREAGEESAGPVWDEKARERLEKVPAMARSMAKSAIERYAREKGIKAITEDVMDEVKKSAMP